MTDDAPGCSTCFMARVLQKNDIVGVCMSTGLIAHSSHEQRVCRRPAGTYSYNTTCPLVGLLFMFKCKQWRA